MIKLNFCLFVTVLLGFYSFAIADDSASEFNSYVEQLEQTPSYAYPYGQLADHLAQEGKASLLLFSYGSLIDEGSASRTLSAKALASRRPAVAFGVKRTFDRDVPIVATSRWGVPCHPDARGMLNVQKTERPEDFINGVLVDLPLGDIGALLDREKGYDLVPVIVTQWETFLVGDNHYQIAYILQAHPEGHYVNAHILPRPGYYELTRDATKQFGPLFEFMWHQSTFMSDGVTPISVWEMWLQEKACMTDTKSK